MLHLTNMSTPPQSVSKDSYLFHKIFNFHPNDLPTNLERSELTNFFKKEKASWVEVGFANKENLLMPVVRSNCSETVLTEQSAPLQMQLPNLNCSVFDLAILQSEIMFCVFLNPRTCSFRAGRSFMFAVLFSCSLNHGEQ